MKNQGLIWVFVIIVVGVVLFAFNYSGNEFISLNDIFPDEDLSSSGIEYEFVDYVEEEAAVEEALKATEEIEEPVAEIAKKGSVTQAPIEKKVKEPVVVEKIAKPATTPAPEVKSAGFSDVPFTIQVLSSKDRTSTEKVLSKIKKEGHPAYLVTANLGEKGTWHRIYVGKFSTKAKAKEYLAKVQTGYKG
ncbi:MAG: SPOR domain-containing protein, partial [Candidatus Omnitrophica bacterium]|nr:SPOR domain-containing protein [Candidatus Omnitrophota bacterium]